MSVWNSMRCANMGDPPPSSAVFAAAERLANAASEAGMVPDEKWFRGYYPTICLMWSDGEIEVEVSEKEYELYWLPHNQPRGRDGFEIRQYAVDKVNDLEALLTQLAEYRSRLQ